jgi:hypothetical protein
MREPVPGRHRLRRRVDRDAQPAAQNGDAQFQSGHGGVDVLPQRDEPRDDQADQEGDDRLGLQGAAPGPSHRQGSRIGAGTDAASSADRRQASDQGADHPLHQQADAGRLAKRTSRALLDIEDDEVVPIIRDPARAADDAEAVFYFPGCGSERLFSQVGLATQAMLYHVGVQTVLPPGYLCCGYPQTSAGNHDEGQKITTANRVLFHRVANTLNYLDIKTVIVSCGTCMDQLQKYEFDKIFPGCRLLDIHEYRWKRGGAVGRDRNAVCITTLPHADEAVRATGGGQSADGDAVLLSDRCCGESGQLAMTRPGVSTQSGSGKRRCATARTACVRTGSAAR